MRMNSAARYQDERDHSIVWAYAKSDDAVGLDLVSEVDADLFRQPLTLELDLPAGATFAQALGLLREGEAVALMPEDLDLRRRFGLPIRARDFGDVRENFSPRGIRRLLARTGFTVEKVFAREKGKRDIGWLMSLYYFVSGWLAEVLGIGISPGLIIIARCANDLIPATDQEAS